MKSPPPVVAKETSGGVKNHTFNTPEAKAITTNQTTNATAPATPATNVPVSFPVQKVPHQNSSSNSSVKSDSVKGVAPNGNYTASLARKQINGKNHTEGNDESMESLMKCDFFDGKWVKDDSYPLYKPDSCSLIDEQFNCIRNGRPDKEYQTYKWKPKGCSLPRYWKILNLLFLVLGGKVFNLMDVYVNPKLTIFVCFMLLFCLANGKLLCFVLY